VIFGSPAPEFQEDDMNIFKDGILVDVNVCFWSGAKALTAQDLGLEEDKIAEAYKLGRKMLIPADTIRKFRALESKARHLVEQNSFKFPLGNARFIPRKKFPRVLKALKEYQQKYTDQTDALIINYDKLRKEMLPIYRHAAATAFERQTPIGVQEFSLEEQEHEKKNFIRNFLYRIRKFYPEAETLRTRFSLNWDVYEIALPRLKTGKAEYIADKQIKAEIANGVYREQTQKKIGTFIDEVVGTLRQETVTICDKIIKNIKGGKVIKGRTLKALKDFIDSFSEFNFVGDAVVENQLTALKEEFLEKHTTPAISKDVELQEELHRRLSILSETASKMTDINSVTGEYHRKINF
jgi:hypothetical protein